ncbi:hypothetical protein [Luteolibacter sp. LG18]|uniref:hypothetical protein n=1 Tax=Luteolibacter sp. LG18 TaxID=2819286 RepID=UPI0030C6D30E
MALLFGMAAVCSAVDKDFNAVDGPNVRVMRHEDGSRTMFERSPDNLTLTTKTFTGGGVLQLLTIYRMDKNTNPLSCKIYDGQRQELFKVNYGYRKSDGQLVAEAMFDSRAKRLNPQTGEEMPVRYITYTYDSNGKRSAPTAITTQKGALADDLYKGKKIDPFVPEDNPFKQAAPAKPAGRR